MRHSKKRIYVELESQKSNERYVTINICRNNGEEWSRRQSGKTMNLPSSMGTPKLQLFADQPLIRAMQTLTEKIFHKGIKQEPQQEQKKWRCCIVKTHFTG